jgi:hypothetical protein
MRLRAGMKDMQGEKKRAGCSGKSYYFAIKKMALSNAVGSVALAARASNFVRVISPQSRKCILQTCACGRKSSRI